MVYTLVPICLLTLQNFLFNQRDLQNTLIVWYWIIFEMQMDISNVFLMEVKTKICVFWTTVVFLNWVYKKKVYRFFFWRKNNKDKSLSSLLKIHCNFNVMEFHLSWIPYFDWDPFSFTTSRARIITLSWKWKWSKTTGPIWWKSISWIKTFFVKTILQGERNVFQLDDFDFGKFYCIE